MKKSVYYTLGVFIAVIVIFNFILDDKTFSTLKEQADYEYNTNQYEKAAGSYYLIARETPLDIDKQYEYISAHFQVPEKKKVGKRRYEYRDDYTIVTYYDSLSQTSDTGLADIGYYSLGLIASYKKEYTEAQRNFNLVKNSQLKYLNNSIGYLYLNNDSPRLAEEYFRKEISLKGNISGAYSNISNILLREKRIPELQALILSDSSSPYISNRVKRAVYFLTYQPLPYAKLLFKNIISPINIWGTLAALFILITWIIYLRKLDLFEAEKWIHIIITVCLGMLFSFMTYPLSDFDNLVVGFSLNEGLVNDFFYSVIGIGAIEELVKIIPLLLMMYFTKAINEPFDYIKYASLSALGFAFIENLVYFDLYHLNVIHGRALFSVVTHMFDSSIIAYGIILAKYKTQRFSILYFFLFFVLAALSHGFYDFWLINEAASTFSIITTLYAISSIYMWNSFKNNALNHSGFFSTEKVEHWDELHTHLLNTLIGICLLEYIAVALTLDYHLANSNLFSSIVITPFMIIFLADNMGNFKLSKGEWVPIKYWKD